MLDDPVEITRAGRPGIMVLPDAARPDCEACPKPELGRINIQTLRLYNLVREQQTTNPMSGHRLGLRLEAVIAGIKWLMDAHEIDEPDEVMRRVMVMDAISNRHLNAKIDAASKKGK